MENETRRLILSTVSHLNVVSILARPFLPGNVRLPHQGSHHAERISDKRYEHPRLWGFLFDHYTAMRTKLSVSPMRCSVIGGHFGCATGKDGPNL